MHDAADNGMLPEQIAIFPEMCCKSKYIVIQLLEAVLNFSKKFFCLDVSVFVCALGDFLVLFAPVLRQIARYLPHHRSENASKTHPKSSHDKFKTAS